MAKKVTGYIKLQIPAGMIFIKQMIVTILA